MRRFKSTDLLSIQNNLLEWFEKNQRDLPWRHHYRPYQVWISEIMLQQTQVKTVLPYFDRWIKKLPTIQSVAEADEQVILKLWEGLGYYSRARNLHKAAKVMVEKFEGQFPSNYEDILSLPGVGKYTAGAISSIAFNQDRPIVDGNVIRVIARLLNFADNTRLPKNVNLMWQRAQELIPAGRARYFNQAMMELGALICTPKNTRCIDCPVQKNCSSFRAGTFAQLPNRGTPTKLEQIKVAIAVIQRGDEVFIQRRPSKGLMGGLWEFPGGKVEKKESVKKALEREIQEELGIRIKSIRPITQIKHGYTRFRVDLHCFSADLDSGEITLNSATEGRWVKTSELSDYPFPAANVKLIQMLNS